MYQSTTLLYYSIVQILHTVNDVEVIVSTCTCTDVFTVITPTDQSGGVTAQVPGIYDSKQTSLRA